MLKRAGLLRSPIVIAIGALLLLALLAFVVLNASGLLRARPHYDSTASLSTFLTDSAEGQQAIARFDSLGPEPLRLGAKAFVMMDLAWTAEDSPEDGCQAQLAIHTPADWQLVGWASNQPIANATINSWGQAQEQHAELAGTKDTIVIASTTAGRAMIVWRSSPQQQTITSTVRAFIVYACGDSDRATTLSPVTLTNQ